MTRRIECDSSSEKKNWKEATCPKYLPIEKRFFFFWWEENNMKTWSSVDTGGHANWKEKKLLTGWMNLWILKIRARRLYLVIFIRPQYLCPFPLSPLNLTCPQPSPWLYSHHTWEKCFINFFKGEPLIIFLF